MSQAFSISNAKTYLSLTPGEVFDGELIVTNLSASEPLLLAVSPAPFSVQDETYSLTFEDSSDHTQILNWVTLTDYPDSIPPGEKGTVKYQISVPETAPAGGQYFALLVSSSAPSAADTSASINIENSAKIASLFYVSVAGETKKDIKILENTVKPFYLNSPVVASSLVKNSSNVHLPVSYSLTVTSLLDGVDLYSNKENSDSRTLLPDTVFFNEQTWEDTPPLGLFKITQELSYLGKTDLAETYTFVCPGWFLGLLIALLLSIVLAIFERIFRYKKSRKQSRSNSPVPAAINREERGKKLLKNPEKSLDERKHKDYNNKYKKVIQK